MEIQPKQPSAKGPADTFTGDVWIDAITGKREASRIKVNAVLFTPGARTAWHSHSLGQTIYVTAGTGLVQSRGEEIVEIGAGDVVYTPDGEEHWHGATATNFMAHLSMTEGEAHWGLHVTDAEYRGEKQ